MKKITLGALIIFVICAGGIYVFSVFTSPIQNQEKKYDLKTPTSAVSESNQNTMKIFTAEEIAKHSTKSDCYLSINNNVYDVTSFIDSHPGGSDTILSRCGKEVTSIFAKIHSNQAWDLLGKYKIGVLQSGE